MNENPFWNQDQPNLKYSRPFLEWTWGNLEKLTFGEENSELIDNIKETLFENLVEDIELDSPLLTLKKIPNVIQGIWLKN